MNILITGVSSGIGRGLCAYYLSRGHAVWGISRRGYGTTEERLTEWKIDLSETRTLSATLNELEAPSDGFDLVVLNAGILGQIKDLADTTLAELRTLMDINLWANKVLMDYLIANSLCRDLVIAISSGTAASGSRGWNGYALSKAALNMLVSLYAKENPSLHIIALAPGLVDSAMQEYISTLDPGDNMPAISRIQACRGTDKMPDPATFATRFHAILAALKKYDSGSFVDIRTM